MSGERGAASVRELALDIIDEFWHPESRTKEQDADEIARMITSSALLDEVRECLTDCEQVLRLVNEAAGPVPKDAPMPRASSFVAWRNTVALLRELIDTLPGEKR